MTRNIFLHDREFLNPLGYSASSYINSFIGESEYEDKYTKSSFFFASFEIASCESQLQFFLKKTDKEKVEKFISKMKRLSQGLQRKESILSDDFILYFSDSFFTISHGNKSVTLHNFKFNKDYGVDDKRIKIIKFLTKFIDVLIENKDKFITDTEV